MITLDELVARTAARYENALAKTVRLITDPPGTGLHDPFTLACAHNLSVASMWWRDLSCAVTYGVPVQEALEEWLARALAAISTAPTPWAEPKHGFLLPAKAMSDAVTRAVIADGLYLEENCAPADPGFEGPLGFIGHMPVWAATDCCGGILGHSTLCPMVHRDPCAECGAGVATACLLRCGSGSTYAGSTTS